VELLANDTVDGEQRRNDIRESAEQKIGVRSHLFLIIHTTLNWA